LVLGLVSNIARPEGNITGTTTMTSELAAKRLELLKDAVPSMSRVLVLSYLIDPIAPLQVKTLEAAAPSLGVKLHIQEIRSADDLPAAFDAAARESPEGLLVTAESIFNVNRKRCRSRSGGLGCALTRPHPAGFKGESRAAAEAHFRKERRE
jgi:ABC-type uncharacterized transport system substrate-binding protein